MPGVEPEANRRQQQHGGDRSGPGACDDEPEKSGDGAPRRSRAGVRQPAVLLAPRVVHPARSWTEGMPSSLH